MASDFTLYAIVNYKTCGWCRKFQPVLETNLKAMNTRAQERVKMVQLDTKEGQELANELGFSGGIPCLIAKKGDQEVYRKPGYQDGPTFANTVFSLYSMYA